MAEKTEIGWCDATWPMIAGCTKVSPGCQHCWAIRTANRMSQHPSAAVRAAYGGTVERHSGWLEWSGTVRCLPERLDWPLHWRQGKRIFASSSADLFHEAVPDAFIARVFGVMASTAQHTYLILTKRPRRMQELLVSEVFRDTARQRWLETAYGDEPITWGERTHVWVRERLFSWPLPNVHIGATTEDQDRLQDRLGDLLRTPAAVHWLSLEPLLSHIALDCVATRLPHRVEVGTYNALLGEWWPAVGNAAVEYAARETELPHVDWIVVGGESGGPPERRLVESCPKLRWDTHARGRDPALACDHCHDTRWIPKTEALAWLLRLQHDCDAAGVPFFFKGFGGPTATAGGHLLDGRTWQQLPEVR